MWNGSSTRAIGPAVMSSVSKMWYSPRDSLNLRQRHDDVAVALRGVGRAGGEGWFEDGDVAVVGDLVRTFLAGSDVALDQAVHPHPFLADGALGSTEEESPLVRPSEEALVDLRQFHQPVVGPFGGQRAAGQVDGPAADRAAGHLEERDRRRRPVRRCPLERERWTVEDRGVQGDLAVVGVGGQRVHDVLGLDLGGEPPDVGRQVEAGDEGQHDRQVGSQPQSAVVLGDPVPGDRERLERHHDPVLREPHVVGHRGRRGRPKAAGTARPRRE